MENHKVWLAPYFDEEAFVCFTASFKLKSVWKGSPTHCFDVAATINLALGFINIRRIDAPPGRSSKRLFSHSHTDSLLEQLGVYHRRR